MLVKNKQNESSIVTFVSAVSSTPPRPDQIVNLLEQEQLDTASSDENGMFPLSCSVRNGLSTHTDDPQARQLWFQTDLQPRNRLLLSLFDSCPVKMVDHN